MDVLAVCVPGPGHVRPLLPLITSLGAQGDRVVVASGTDVAGAVERAGAEHCPAGRGEGAWFDDLRGRVRGVPGDGLAPERINHYFVPRLFAEVAAVDMIDEVLACGRTLRPDLVLFETYALAGPLAAALLGVPGVHHLIGPMLEDDVLRLADDAVSPLWRSFGVDTPGFAGVYAGTTIAVCPPSLEMRGIPAGERLLMRPAPVPAADPPAAGRPVVYVTLGTFFNASTDVFRTVLTALEDDAVDVVVTVGTDQDPAALAPVPANARVERFIPQAELLPHCAAVVHHGGAGTMFGSLAHGLPQLVVPQGADNFVNAALLERAGIGLVVRPGEVTAATVREAVHRIIGEPGFGAAAAGVASEIAAMPDAGGVAATLRSVAGRRRA